MHAISLHTNSHWIERLLDGVDVLRDSVPNGIAIAKHMRDEAKLNQDEVLCAAAALLDAFASYFQNDVDNAAATFQKLSLIFARLDQVEGVFFADTGLLIVLRKIGEVQAALVLAEQKIIPKLDVTSGRLSILALNIVAIVCQERGETVSAIRYFYRGLDEAKAINALSQIAQLTANLGEVLCVTGNPKDAEEFLELATKMAASSEQWLLPFSSAMLALCQISLGRFEEAYQTVARYLENEPTNAPKHLTNINSYQSFYLSVAAYTLAMRGQLQEAMNLSEKALTAINMIEDAHLKPYIWWVNGFLHRRLGNFDQAIIQLRHAVDGLGESGYMRLPLCAINELSEIYAELGQWQAAYIEQRRHQVLFMRAQENANQIQTENLRIRNEFEVAKHDRHMNELMTIERKSLDDELQHMLAERETVLENSIVGMIFLNSQGRIQWVNTPLCHIFGAERDNVLGASLEPFYASRESYLENGAAVGQAVLRGESFETELQMRRGDGSLFWVQFSGRAVNKNDLSYGTVWVVMDISARRQLEDDLYKSEYNYRLLINNVTEGIVVIQNGQIAFANLTIQRLTGYSRDELIGMPFTAPIHTDDVAAVIERHQRFLREESVEQYFQIRLRHCISKQYIWVEISSVLIEWEGQPATLSFVSDLTQRKLLESQLKDSMDEQIRLQTLQMQNELKVSELARRHAEESTEAKSLFLANMSHEIRTPMNAIIGMTHLVLRADLTAKQKEYFERIHKAGLHLMEIINNVLDFSKIEIGQLEIEESEFDLDEVFNSVAVVTSKKAEQKGLEYLFDIDEDVPKRMKGDPIRLGQILINLVNNAIKFTEEGEVCLQCRVSHYDAAQVRLRFDVRDTGLGMSAEQSASLFVPFTPGDESTTRKFGGTGLGLAISKGMVNLMRGEISLLSELGKGTVVSVEIPFARTALAPTETNQALFDQFNVLIVDDHPHAAKLLSTKLGSYGVQSRLVYSGEDALIALAEAECENRQFDAIFVDLHMPYMDGAELIAQIRQVSLQTIPKIALVGATARESLNYRDEATITDAYLDKPFNSFHVFDCLVNMFSYHRHFNAASSLHGAFKCRNLHVLLVEDNLVNQQIAKELLEAADIVVDVADNGRAALDHLFSLDVNYYGLVLMDTQMPELDGIAATRLIRQDARFQELPIIAMTAHTVLMEHEKCLDSGMNAYITKPIKPNELYQTVADWCSSYVAANTDHHIVSSSTATDTALNIQGIDTRLGLSRTMGDRQLYCKLLRLFALDQGDAIEQIRQAMLQSDYKTAERVAHTLKGVAGLIGADVQLLAARIESQIEGLASIEQVASLLDSAELQLHATIAEIEICLKNEYVLAELGDGTGEVKDLSTEEIYRKLRLCYQLVANYDAEALELLNDAAEELNIAFGSDVQKQIMRAASQYDFDVIQSIMKGNAHMIGMSLE